MCPRHMSISLMTQDLRAVTEPDSYYTWALQLFVAFGTLHPLLLQFRCSQFVSELSLNMACGIQVCI